MPLTNLQDQESDHPFNTTLMQICDHQGYYSTMKKNAQFITLKITQRL